jgi:hypothetical protein
MNNRHKILLLGLFALMSASTHMARATIKCSDHDTSPACAPTPQPCPHNRMCKNSIDVGSVHSHAKHGMILLGESEIFASHIVYKEPHNYQVLLSVNLDENTKAAYLAAKRAAPQGLFVMLLDPLDIKEIAAQDVLTGSIFYRDESGQRRVVAPNVTVPKNNFHVIYFDELPLSLSPDGTKIAAERGVHAFNCGYGMVRCEAGCCLL